MTSKNTTPPAGKRQHILITGGAGFIGSHLTERLLADGHSVVVLDDLSTGREENLQAVRNHPDLQFIHSSVSTCDDLPALAEEVDFIYHLAAAVGVDLVVQSPVRTLETNLHCTEAIVRAAASAHVPLLLASTSEVYGKSAKDQFAEDDDLLIGPPHYSRWSYACSKLMDEFLALAYRHQHGLPVIIARLFNIVGPRQHGDHGMVLPRFISAALRDEPLRVFGDGKQTRCFCHVADSIEALVRLQNTPAAHGEIYNIGSTEEISIRDLARQVIDHVGAGRIEYVPYEVAYAPGFEDMRRRRPDTAKLEQAIGFTPGRSFHDIIKSMVHPTKKAP